MDRKAFDPAFISAALCCVLVALSWATRPASVPKFDDERIAALERKLDELVDTLGEPDDAGEIDLGGEIELHIKSDAEQLMADLGKSPAAEKLATAVATVDGWIAVPEESESLQEFKLSQIAVLRQVVRKEVDALHGQALNSKTGSEAAEHHAKASQVLALFPMDTTTAVLDEARKLSSQHAEVGGRLDVIRRQRYNAWAMTRIEEAIKAINAIASSFRTADNPKTIEATVRNLGEVDPLLLEPVVSQLYNYAVEQAKSNVNSEQQLELGRRMIDPAIKRKGYGDF